MQNTTKTADLPGFQRLLQAHGWWFFWFGCAAVALRLLFVLRFPAITPDGVLYGDLAKNWLLHHVLGISGASGPAPTYIRLPGYPAFLAAIWAVFGVDHYNAVRFVQLVIDVASCFVIADLARRASLGTSPPCLAKPGRDKGGPTGGTGSDKGGATAAKWAFALAALCPFLANYTAALLTETLAIFFAAVALDCAVAGLKVQDSTAKTGSAWWAGTGLAVAAGIYLRPDGGIVLMAIGGHLLLRLMTKPRRSQTFWAGVILALCSLLPLAPWTLRNWQVYHRLQPLAPTHATEPDEFYAAGFEHWMRTWLADFASLEDIGFRVDSQDLDISLLPSRAFDNAAERSAVEDLFNRYNETDTMTAAIDAQFEQLARERIRRNRFRCYVELPGLRILDLWLRPRTEILPLDAHWWRVREDPHDFAWSLLLGIINGAYLLLAVVGAIRWREIRYSGLLVAFVLLRTVIINAIAFPEPRYVLECYSVVIVLAAVGLSRPRST